MTTIKLSSGDELEVREDNIFLGDERIQYIEELLDITRLAERVDITLKIDSMCFEIEWGDTKERVPVLLLPLLHNPKKIVLSIDKGSYVLTPTKKLGREALLNILSSASFAWSIVDVLYYMGRIIEYFVNPEIFSKYKMGDVFDEFQNRLSEFKSTAANLPEYVEWASKGIYEIFDFFSELVEKLIEINDVRDMDVSKVQILQELLNSYENTIKDLWFMIHVISRLVFNQKLVSLQMFINCIDKMYSNVFNLISLTAKNVFGIEPSQSKKEKSEKEIPQLWKKGVKRNLQLLIESRKEGTFRKLRNDSPLSHKFKIVDVGPYTTESAAEVLHPIHESLCSLLDVNIRALKMRVDGDSKLQEEMAENGISTDEFLSCIDQLENILLTIKNFSPSEIVRRVEKLRELYLNVFLLIAFLNVEAE